MNQRRLARAVWTEQSDQSTAQFAAQRFEDGSAAETYREIVEGNDTRACGLSWYLGSWRAVGCHGCF